jgi:hypothetical protein
VSLTSIIVIGLSPALRDIDETRYGRVTSCEYGDAFRARVADIPQKIAVNCLTIIRIMRVGSRATRGNESGRSNVKPRVERLKVKKNRHASFSSFSPYPRPYRQSEQH